MKIPRLPLFAAVAVFALNLTCGPALLRAETPDEARHREAAEAFLKARKTEDLVNNQANRMVEMTDHVSDNASKQVGPGTDAKEFSGKMKAEARGIITKDFNWDALKPEFIQAYEQAFTEAELKEMTAFYESPVGKKLVSTEPEIQTRLSKLSQEKAMTIMPRVMQRLREMVAATKPAGSSSANPLAPPTPRGLIAPPSPPPGLMIPPPPPAGMIPGAPPTAVPSASVAAAPIMAPPSGTPPVHSNGKAEPGTP